MCSQCVPARPFLRAAVERAAQAAKGAGFKATFEIGDFGCQF